MLNIEFTPEEIDTLEYERYHHLDPKVQKRIEAVYLKSQRLTHQEICRLCRISEPTLVTYLEQYLEGGIAQLEEFGYEGKSSELDKYAPSLKTYFEAHPPRTVAEAQRVIKDQTGIERSPTQIQAFLKRLGMKCRKVGYVPGRAANPDKQVEQETFKTQELEPRLAEAKAGKRRVLFMDAAHFVLGACLSKVWCFARLFIASPSGRQRFNVLGAVDAVTKEILTVTNETYINAEIVCLLLTNIATKYAGEMITIVLDNARYQKCALVTQHAAALHIELLYLPAYSPNLNLIERFWRYVRKDCLYSKYYPKFDGFKQALTDCIQNAHPQHRDELESLLTWNFQSFEKVKISTV
jgi:transposase